MWALMKKGISIFTLVVMLFPMGASSVHALLHRNDFHCYEKSGKHIHLPEHHCPICDLVPPVFHSPTNILSASIEIAGPITQAYFYKSVLITARAYHFSLRAPPAYA